jgi:hypothetical protein
MQTDLAIFYAGVSGSFGSDKELYARVEGSHRMNTSRIVLHLEMAEVVVVRVRDRSPALVRLKEGIA